MCTVVNYAGRHSEASSACPDGETSHGSSETRKYAASTANKNCDIALALPYIVLNHLSALLCYIAAYTYTSQYVLCIFIRYQGAGVLLGLLSTINTSKY